MINTDRSHVRKTLASFFFESLVIDLNYLLFHFYIEELSGVGSFYAMLNVAFLSRINQRVIKSQQSQLLNLLNFMLNL